MDGSQLVAAVESLGEMLTYEIPSHATTIANAIDRQTRAIERQTDILAAAIIATDKVYTEKNSLDNGVSQTNYLRHTFKHFLKET